MPHILIVCTANICRSPVFEALLRQRLQEQGLDEAAGWTVDSAGTWAIIPRPPAATSVQLMAERGLDISQHRAQMVNHALLAQADLVLCMEMGQLEGLRLDFPEAAGKLFLLAEMVGRQYNIADPYGQPPEAYQRMVAELETILEEGLPNVLHLARLGAAARLAADDEAE